MNSEIPTKPRSRSKTWIAVVCAFGVAVLFVLLVRPSGETITFRIIDRSTRTPLTGVHLMIVEKWTTLPLDKLRLQFLSGWRTQEVISATGTIKIPVKKKANQMFSMTVKAARYHGAIFSFGPGEYTASIHYEPAAEGTYWGRHGQPFGTNKDEVVVELCRKLAVLGD